MIRFLIEEVRALHLKSPGKSRPAHRESSVRGPDRAEKAHPEKVDFRTDEARRIDRNFPEKAGWARRQHLVHELDLARKAFNAGRADKGISRLEQFNGTVTALKREGRIDPDKADFLLAQSDETIGCLRDEGLHLLPRD